ncbi:BTAD domain-containing putative transcriptional regulator [Mycetocola spongiae]|uniref:BTAD domain-containing putative transcriptional regulator n=1 Tax=Mycetocola spongiae TaxID=2859226 RepID=UPI001CF13E9E|nr:BTAD domain-containing putative transcriptional regulator [Mycetocola spongiae]UCR89112.1 hypothetical protein KXZ72_14455 [Mycetocola spongiae]
MHPFPDPPLRLLGPVTVDGTEPSGLLPRVLLAVLALAGPDPVSAGRLAAEIWGEEGPGDARAALQTLISRTRRLLPAGAITLGPAGYRLELGSDLAAAEAARHGQDDAARGAALALWAGAPGAGLGDHPVAAELAEYAAVLRRDLLAKHAAALLAAGNPAAARPLLGELCRAEPLNEAPHEDLIRALDSLGEPAAALAVYAGLRERLASELGSDPSPALRALNTEILRRDAPPAATPAASAAELMQPASTAGIRRFPDPLIGREEDLRGIGHALATGRLVTILGPGGLGKTRLAHAAAAAAAPLIARVIVTELAGVGAASDLPLALGSALGLREAVGDTRLGDARARADLGERILTALAQKPTLLVLDNCEHLIDAVARWGAEALELCADLRILTTSRAPLMIPGEALWEPAPLRSEINGEPGPAVTLFRERALAARPGARLDSAAVAALCDRLDGLPLAIELAAARIRSLSLAEIAAGLENRLDFLVSGNRAIPDRHRTLIAVIGWSWNLLTDAEREVFLNTSIFPHGFTRAAAHAVSGRNVDAELEGLALQSLLRAFEHPESGEMRFQMLETVREFGTITLAELGGRERVLTRALDWARELALELLPLTDGPQQVSGFARTLADQDNLIWALRRAADRGDSATAHAIFGLLAFCWARQNTFGELEALALALAPLPAEETGYRGALANSAAMGLLMQSALGLFGSLRRGVLSLRRLRALLDTGAVSDPRIPGLYRLLRAAGDHRALERELAAVCADPRPEVSVYGLFLSAQLAENAGRARVALGLAERAAQRAEALDDLWLMALTRLILAQLYSEMADDRRAVHWARLALPGLRTLHLEENRRHMEWLLAIYEGTPETMAALSIGAGDFPATKNPDEDFRSVGWAGRAELSLRTGHPERGLTEYVRAERMFLSPRDRAYPWYSMVASGSVAAHGLTGVDALPALQRLRRRALALQRLHGSNNDLPVWGSMVLAISTYSLIDPRVADLTLPLLICTRTFSARQELPTLRIATHERRQAEAFGAERFAAAEARVEALDLSGRVALARELLADPLWNTLGAKPA